MTHIPNTRKAEAKAPADAPTVGATTTASPATDATNVGTGSQTNAQVQAPVSPALPNPGAVAGAATDEKTTEAVKPNIPAGDAEEAGTKAPKESTALAKQARKASTTPLLKQGVEVEATFGEGTVTGTIVGYDLGEGSPDLYKVRCHVADAQPHLGLRQARTITIPLPVDLVREKKQEAL